MIEQIIKFLIYLAVALLIVYLVFLLGAEIIGAAGGPALILVIWKIICLLLAVLAILAAARKSGFAVF